MRTVLLILLFGLLVSVPAAGAVAAADAAKTPAASSNDGLAVPAEDKAPDQAKASWSGTDALIASLTIFVLAIFVGFEVITKVPPTLHTPLMSGSNAISGITIVGALLAAGIEANMTASVLGMIAVAMATINVVGGFLVTHRMLGMFRKK